ncbi:hypothetical protein Pcinc_040158 [Petrolisthes cinctipes]|uniref:Uncharacterized protein n=1 Tax=Petrolisthes cinctipes TaxID=88211 RepID=A0AAE1BM44_PETCI|nr:hypothetical protein Pcinc_040158 [Petrolisthes cinctipes]
MSLPTSLRHPFHGHHSDPVPDPKTPSLANPRFLSHLGAPPLPLRQPVDLSDLVNANQPSHKAQKWIPEKHSFPVVVQLLESQTRNLPLKQSQESQELSQPKKFLDSQEPI